VIVDPERIDDGACNVIARDIAKRVSEEMTFPCEIRITVLREMRTVDLRTISAEAPHVNAGLQREIRRFSNASVKRFAWPLQLKPGIIPS